MFIITRITLADNRHAHVRRVVSEAQQGVFSMIEIDSQLIEVHARDNDVVIPIVVDIHD